MTSKELLDALAEIQQLKHALGLETRIVKVPKGTTGRCESGTRGRCVVCDLTFEAHDTIRRCCKDVTAYDKRTGETRYQVVGQRVCFRCSPWVWDWQLERYAQGMSEWPEHWRNGSDTGVFGNRAVTNKTVFELDLQEHDDDEQYLIDKIARLEAVVKSTSGR